MGALPNLPFVYKKEVRFVHDFQYSLEITQWTSELLKCFMYEDVPQNYKVYHVVKCCKLIRNGHDN